MALKEYIIIWSEAVKLYENGDLNLCLQKLNHVKPSAKIYYNKAMVYIRLNKHEEALECLNQAILLDSFMAVAYFQRSLLFFHLKRYNECEVDLESSMKYLRDSPMIDYRQLGLYTQLHLSQILYNQAVVKKIKGDMEGFQLYWDKFFDCTKDQDLFTEADFASFNKMIYVKPPYSMFCPPKGYVSNLIKKDYLGKSEVVSSVEDHDFVNRMEQKSRSNPSTPVNMRRNNLDVKTTTRMAVTPPPAYPPPRIKPADLVKEQDSQNMCSNKFRPLSVPQRPQRPVPVVRVQTKKITSIQTISSKPTISVGKQSQFSETKIVHETDQRTVQAVSSLSSGSHVCVPLRPIPQKPVLGLPSKMAAPPRPPPFNNICDKTPGDKKSKPDRPPPPKFK